MSLTEKQIRDLNRMNRASQNVQLGTMLDEIINEINTGLPGEGDMKKSVYATNDKSNEGYVDKAIKSDVADTLENAELSDGTKLLTETEADEKYLKISGSQMSGSIDMNGNRIVNAGEPVEPSDYATKQYVDENSGKYELPIATDEILGGIKVGSGLDISDDGVLSIIGGSTGQAVIQRDSYLNFPTIGNEGLLYVDSTENCSYRWDSKELKYYMVGFNYNNLKIIDGGNANG